VSLASNPSSVNRQMRSNSSIKLPGGSRPQARMAPALGATLHGDPGHSRLTPLGSTHPADGVQAAGCGLCRGGGESSPAAPSLAEPGVREAAVRASPGRTRSLDYALDLREWWDCLLTYRGTRRLMVLPAPLGPRKPKTSPAVTWRSRPSTAALPRNRLVRPWQRMASRVASMAASRLRTRSSKAQKTKSSRNRDCYPFRAGSPRTAQCGISPHSGTRRRGLCTDATVPLEQLRDNLGAAGWRLEPAHLRALEVPSRLEPEYPRTLSLGSRPLRVTAHSGGFMRA
jgi:hypothetical protein